MTKKKKRIIAIVILIAMVVTTILGVAITVSAKDKQQTAYVYIGDSRTVQLDKLIGKSTMTDTFVIAKSGMGYNWWTHTGSTQLSEIRKNNPSYTNWIYIFNLGVNDLVNVDKYNFVLCLEKKIVFSHAHSGIVKLIPFILSIAFRRMWVLNIC